MSFEIIPTWAKTFERHKRDLVDVKSGKKQNLRFNRELGLKYVYLLETFKHYKGVKAGEYFSLEDWQKRSIAIWAGWEKKNSNGIWVRRFGRSFWFIPKKNGKTLLASGLAVVDSILRGEEGAEIYSFATKRDQAMLAWNGFKEMLEKHPIFKSGTNVSYSTINLKNNNKIEKELGKKIKSSFFKPLGRDSTTIDGINTYFGVADERHAHPDNSVYDNVESSMASRLQPHLMSITTAGFNVYSPCYEDYLHAKKVLDGVIEDDDLFVFIAEAPKKPEGEEYKDWYFREDVIKAANPNFGVSVQKDFILKEAKRAQTEPKKLNSYLVKHLNVWTSAAESFFSLDDWISCKGEVNADGEFVGGLDLSINDDFTSFIKLYRKNGIYYIKPFFYVPKEGVQEREKVLKVPLVSWINQGYITATPGKTTNYIYIYNEIEKDIDNMKMLGYDIYKAKKLIKLIAEPIDTDIILEFGEDLDLNNIERYKNSYENCIPITQGYRTLSEPTIWLKQLIKDKKIVHDGNPVLTWMISNCSVQTNPQGNVMLDKSDKYRKIDGVAATVNALALFLHDKEEKIESAYENRGLRDL